METPEGASHGCCRSPGGRRGRRDRRDSLRANDNRDGDNRGRAPNGRLHGSCQHLELGDFHPWPDVRRRSSPVRLRGTGVAVGSGTGSATGAADVATQRNGIWGAAQGFATGGKSAVPVAGVIGVACSSQGNCVAGGAASRALGSPPKKAETWGEAQLISGSTVNASLSAVSCVPNGGCTAVGSLHPNPNERELSDGMAVTESDGTWGKPRVVLEPKASSWPVFALNSGSCTARGDCTAGGYLYNGGEGGYQENSSVLVAETNGVWGAATPVPQSPERETSPTTTSWGSPARRRVTARRPASMTSRPCRAGTVVAGSFVITETGGRWQRATIIPASGGGYLVTSLSCFSIGHCVIAGDEAEQRRSRRR